VNSAPSAGKISSTATPPASLFFARENELPHRLSDDAAYILPMALFVALTEIAVYYPAFFPIDYAIKTFLAAILLIAFRRHYLKIRWNFAWLGAIVGILGFFQWVGMEKALLAIWPHYPRPLGASFDPTQIASPQLRSLFLIIRFAGPVLVVPFMEELFWRDYVWRTIAAPNDFKLASIGEFDWYSITIVTVLFSSLHVQWITAIVWGAIIAALLIKTKSLGSCIVAHAITNLLLGIYVVYTHDWSFW
jgi:uncharacterized protein